MTEGVTEESGKVSKSRSRIDRLRLLLSKADAEFLIVPHLPNIRYLCGFSGDAGLLLVGPTQSTLLTDSRYTFQARQEVGQEQAIKIHIAREGLFRALGGSLKRLNRRVRVAYPSAQMSVAQQRSLAKAAGNHVRLLSGENLVEKLRAVKEPAEIAAMRGAAELISEVFEEVMPRLAPGISELAVAAEIEYAMKQKGASGPSFETIVASGERSAWAHARPTDRKLRKNELVVLDHGAILHGYCSDMTRTVFLGRPSSKTRKMYEGVLEAQAAAKRAIRPGVMAAEVDRAARKSLKRRGLAKYFTHSTGHGLGIEVHEMPRLGRGDQTILEAGMVITVEPGVYVEGWGGIRIEDDVLVTADGAIDLTRASREFLEL